MLLPVAASQMRAVLSSDAVTMRDPSGLNAAEFTIASWPRRTAIALPVAASQMRAVLSSDAVTMREPSGLNAAEQTQPLVVAQNGDLLGGRGVPDARGLVVRRGDDARAVGAERGGMSPNPRGRCRTAICLAVAASQTRAVLSSDAVTMRDPSGLKAAELTNSLVAAQDGDRLPVAASQMRAVLSSDAVTMRDPSGLKAAD